jgi:hypothetical protein
MMPPFAEVALHLRRWLQANQLDPDQVEVTIEFKEARLAYAAHRAIVREMSPLTTGPGLIDFYSGRLTMLGMPYRITVAPERW